MKKGKKKWGWPILKFEKRSISLPVSFGSGIIFSKSVPITFAEFDN